MNVSPVAVWNTVTVVSRVPATILMSTGILKNGVAAELPLCERVTVTPYPPVVGVDVQR